MNSNPKISISIAINDDIEILKKIPYDIYNKELLQEQTNKVDEFNTYIVAKINSQIVGFISLTPASNNNYSIDKYFTRNELPFLVDDNLIEIRILKVIQKHRKQSIERLLSYASLRWAEVNGYSNIVAIGRKGILDLFIKFGLKTTNQFFKSGAVTFELLYAHISTIRKITDNQLKLLIADIFNKCIWKMDFDFYKPAQCYHGGAFFDAIGSEFNNLDKKENIINADVLDAWFNPSPIIKQELEKYLTWICKTSPPTDCGGMRDAIARKRGVKPINILPGAGTSDLIYLTFREWLNPSSKVLIIDPSYGEYSHILENVIQCNIDIIELNSKNNFALNLNELIVKSKNNYDLIVLVNPNSPTGQHISREELINTIKLIPKNIRIWIDETYIEYSGKAQSLEKFAVKTNNVIICKSMSKVYALSGLRSAYLCAAPSQLEKLKSITPPWAVSLPAQIAAVIAINDDEYYLKCYKETHRLRSKLVKGLEQLNTMKAYKSTTNFILFKLYSTGPNAKKLVQLCKEKGLFLRDVSNMGKNLGNYTIRIAVKDNDTNQRMINILRKIFQEYKN